MALSNIKEIEFIQSHLDKPVVLIGMMGAGKTRVGKMLSQCLSLEFVDSDDEIVEAAGCSIADIFERYGEQAFRDGERRVLKRLLNEGAKLIATGGGAVMAPDTGALIWENTISIWINTEISVLVERTGRNDRRPLLQQGDPEKILRELIEKRYPVYKQADIEIDGGKDRIDDVLAEATDKLYKFLGGEA